MLYVDIYLVGIIGAILVYSALATAPRAFRDAPRHVLICCAHSDDCVILGAEYVYGVVRRGLTVRIAYLTCSGPTANSDIAKIRKAEALAAWSALGVPALHLSFMNLSESPVRGPLAYTGKDIEVARRTLTEFICSLPQNAAIIIPAEGKFHVDHVIVRNVALNAMANAKRDDVVIYESPEYNAFLSLEHCPEKSVRAILRSVPLLNRLIRPYAGSATYVSGPPGFVFRDTRDRLAKKKELFRYFSSQNPDLLARAFGYRSKYRIFRPSDKPREPSRRLCVLAFGGCCGPSVLALGIAALGVAFLTTHELANRLVLLLLPVFPIDKYVICFAGLITIAYLIRSIRRTSSLESSLLIWAVGLGLMLGALQI